MKIKKHFDQRMQPVLLFAILALTLISVILLWQYWQRNAQHHKHITLVTGQNLAAAQVHSYASMLLAAPENTDAKIKLSHAADVLADLSARCEELSIGFPQIAAIYNDAPYHLRDKLTRVLGLLDKSADPKNDDLQQLSKALDSEFYDGLHRLSTELERHHTNQKPWLLPYVLLSVFAAVLMLAAYHRLALQSVLKHQQLSKAEAQDAKDKLHVLTQIDPLTGTSNRKAITSFLSDFQNQQATDGEFVALAILDIDHFQQINDVFGYFAGDAVLQEVALRISGELRNEDQLGRMNSDHFAIVLCGLIAPKTAESIIHRIQEVIATPIKFNNAKINVTCSVGAAVQEVSALDLAELFKLSEQALLQAKQNRRGSIFLFSENAQLALSRQREIRNVIKESEFDNIFELAYQPIVSLEKGNIVGCECLLRWIADSPADLQTSELLPTLEMYGDIHAVGNWVLRQSLAQLKKWQALLPASSLFISINVSAVQLEAEEFATNIVALAEELALAPGDISLELTETVAIKHLEAGRKQLALLRNLGFGVSLDDFGTGYSSLQYLKTMPASTIKIDQAFIREMTSDRRDAAIVDSAINIARAIGLTVVAEGIDSAVQAEQLRIIGCHYGQGFHFFKPLSYKAFEQAVLAQQANG